MNMTNTALSNTNYSQDNLKIEIIEIQNPTCNSSNNGQITIEPKGGVAPYQYDWNTFPNQTTPTAENLSSGVYFIQVTDANGSTFFQSIELLAPETIDANDNSSMPSDESVVSLEFSMNGGNAPYTYEFNGSQISEPVVNNLTIGIHTMVITDANNCSMIQYIQVFEIEEDSNNNNSLGWTIFNDKPEVENKVTRVEFSDLVPLDAENEEENLVADE